MVNRTDDRERLRRAFAATIAEKEREAAVAPARGHQYGRRIECDGSWTLYHVFTGAPARVGGRIMTGLSRLEVSDNMLSLNK